MAKYSSYTLLSCLIAQQSCSLSVQAFQSTFGNQRSRLSSSSSNQYGIARAGDLALKQTFNNDDYFISSTRTTNNNQRQKKKRDQSSSLQAFTMEQFMQEETAILAPSTDEQTTDWSGLQSVITTALMVTGNTIGASALVVPELVAKPGMALSTGLFGGE